MSKIIYIYAIYLYFLSSILLATNLEKIEQERKKVQEKIEFLQNLSKNTETSARRQRRNTIDVPNRTHSEEYDIFLKESYIEFLTEQCEKYLKALHEDDQKIKFNETLSKPYGEMVLEKLINLIKNAVNLKEEQKLKEKKAYDDLIKEEKLKIDNFIEEVKIYMLNSLTGDNLLQFYNYEQAKKEFFSSIKSSFFELERLYSNASDAIYSILKKMEKINKSFTKLTKDDDKNVKNSLQSLKKLSEEIIIYYKDIKSIEEHIKIRKNKYLNMLDQAHARLSFRMKDFYNKKEHLKVLIHQIKFEHSKDMKSIADGILEITDLFIIHIGNKRSDLPLDYLPKIVLDIKEEVLNSLSMIYMYRKYIHTKDWGWFIKESIEEEHFCQLTSLYNRSLSIDPILNYLNSIKEEKYQKIIVDPINLKNPLELELNFSQQEELITGKYKTLDNDEFDLIGQIKIKVIALGLKKGCSPKIFLKNKKDK